MAYINEDDSRHLQNAQRTPGSSYPRPSGQKSLRGEGGDRPVTSAPHDGEPRGSDRANKEGVNRRGLGRRKVDSDDFFGLPSEGESRLLGADELLHPGGERFTIEGAGYEMLNHQGGSSGGDSLIAEATAALSEFGGLRQGGVESSLLSRGKVTIPSEGGPDSQRSM